MTNLITRITARLAAAWAFLKRNWAIIVPPTVVAVTLGLAAVAATTTLTRCGCSGPVPTPTPTATPTVTPVVTPTPTAMVPPTVTIEPTPVITPSTACSFGLWYEHPDGAPLFATVDVTDTVNRPEPVYRFDARWRAEDNGTMVSQGTIPNALEPITASMTVEFTPTGQLNGDLVFTPTTPYSGVFNVYVYGCWVDYAMSYPTFCMNDGEWQHFGQMIDGYCWQ